MIVKCDACQTRFRIPDEKVTEKGVKVRCTKCQTTFRVSRAGPASSEPAAPPLPPPVPEVPAAPPPPAFDPFAAFGPTESANFDEATRPFTLSPAAMAELGLTPPAAAQPAPPAPPPAASEFPSFDGGSGFGDDLFGDQTAQVTNPLGTTPAAAQPPPLPTPPAAADPFALLDAPQATRQASPFEATQPAHPMAQEEDPFENARAAFEPAFGELSSPGFGMPSAFSDGTQPGIQPGGEMDRDAFGSAEGALDPTASTGTFQRPVDRAMFEMPARQPQSGGLLEDVPPDPFGAPGAQDEVTATGILAAAAPPPPAAAEPTRIAPAPQPPAASARQAEVAPEPLPEESGGLFRSLGGAIVNIAAAILLLSGVAVVAGVYFNGGRMDLASLSPDHLQHLWARSGDVVPRDVSNGLYDTQGGKAVLYVRGFVENRTGRNGKVKVTAEIYDGDQLLRTGTVYAGQSPTPEDLAAISGQTDVESLVARLNKAAEGVGPGKRVPFLVPFYEYPNDLTGLRMKVTVSAPESAPAKH